MIRFFFEKMWNIPSTAGTPASVSPFSVSNVIPSGIENTTSPDTDTPVLSSMNESSCPPGARTTRMGRMPDCDESENLQTTGFVLYLDKDGTSPKEMNPATPDTPLKEIFSRRNLLGAGIAAAVLGTADGFLKEYVAHYEIWRNVACCAAGAVLLSVFTVRQLTKKKAKQAG